MKKEFSVALVLLLMLRTFLLTQREDFSSSYLKLDLAEEIILKESETDQNYLFGGITDLSVDSFENFYILDSRLKRIIKYDKKGKFIKKIGREGQGPGEFIFPLKIFVDEKDNLYVNDQGRAIIVYDKDGDFKSLLRLKKPIGDFYVDKNGYIYTFTRDFSESGIVKLFVKMDKEGNIVKKIAEFLEADVKIKVSGGGGVMGGVKHPYSFDSFFCSIPGDFLCYGDNSKYKLFVYDLEGSLKSEISKEVKAQPITGAEKEKFSKSEDIVFPPYRPFFKGILSDEKGRIWVIRTKSILEKDKKEIADIFSKEGRYLYEVELPYFPKIIRDGNIWVIDRDEEDRTLIKKLIIKNYSSMKY